MIDPVNSHHTHLRILAAETERGLGQIWKKAKMFHGREDPHSKVFKRRLKMDIEWGNSHLRSFLWRRRRRAE
jgi:hypothetical protein